MEDQLISYNTAILAKERGFDLVCIKGYYTYGEDIKTALKEYDNPIDIDISQECVFNNACKPFKNSQLTKGYLCTAPTQSILQKWLRDIHNIHILVSNNNQLSSGKWSYDIHKLPSGILTMWSILDPLYDTYEETLEIGLYEALKLVK